MDINMLQDHMNEKQFLKTIDELTNWQQPLISPISADNTTIDVSSFKKTKIDDITIETKVLKSMIKKYLPEYLL